MLYAEWNGKTVKVYNHAKRIVRTLIMSKDVSQVICSGEEGNGLITITMIDGKTKVYKDNGIIFRA